MSADDWNLLLALLAATGSGVLVLWRRNAFTILVALILPLIAVSCFWGFHYLAVPQDDVIGTRGWIALFFLKGTIFAYTVALPILLLILSIAFLRSRRRGEQGAAPNP